MPFQSSGEFIEKLQLRFNLLIALPLLLVGIGYLQIKHAGWQPLLAPSRALLMSTVAGLTVLVTYLSLRFKKEARKLTAFPDLASRMTAYYQLAMFYYWSVFALAVLATALLYLFAEVALAAVYVYTLFWLSVFRPNLRSLADIFGLQDEERRKFIQKEDLL